MSILVDNGWGIESIMALCCATLVLCLVFTTLITKTNGFAEKEEEILSENE